MDTLVSGQKQCSVWLWTERVATMMTKFERQQMVLARQVCLCVCVCVTSAFLWSICLFANVQIHS